MKTLISCLLFLFLILFNIQTGAGSIILTVLLVIWLAVLVTRKISQESNFNENLLIAGFTIYYAVSLLSFIVNGVSTDLYTPRSSHIDNELRMLAVVPLYFLMRQYKPHQWCFWYGLAAGATVSGITALYQLISLGPEFRVLGIDSPITFGGLAIVMAFMVMTGWDYFRSQHRYLIIVPIVAFISGITTAILSQSRGVWLALPLLFGVLIWQYRKKAGPVLLIAVTVIAIGITSMVPGNPLAPRTQLAIDQVISFSRGYTLEEGASPRLELWKVAWELFQENPVLGVGQGAFQPIILDKISTGEISPGLSGLKEPHNIFLNAMVNNGMLGLLAVIICFAVPLYLLIGFLRKNIDGHSFAYAGIVLVIAFLHFGLTESLFQRNIYINYYLIMLAFILSRLQAFAPIAERKKQ